MLEAHFRARHDLARIIFAVLICVPSFGCAPNGTSADLAVLQDELWANETALAATKDTLRTHQSAAQFHLLWMEGVQDAGSGTLWDAMRLLSHRPAPTLQRSAFDDFALRGALQAVVPSDGTRRELIAYYERLSRLEDVARDEYRSVAMHYEAVLGPGEWRSVLEPDVGPESFPVDYRLYLQRLVEDNHGARLRGLIRAQAEYLEELTAAYELTHDLLTALARM
jgi:hypothetical protein